MRIEGFRDLKLKHNHLEEKGMEKHINGMPEQEERKV